MDEKQAVECEHVWAPYRDESYSQVRENTNVKWTVTGNVVVEVFCQKCLRVKSVGER